MNPALPLSIGSPARAPTGRRDPPSGCVQAPPRASRRAFSLIELLINLAIIGALVGVAVPYFRSYTYQAQSSRARSDIEIFRKAILRFEHESRTKLSGGSLAPLVGTQLNAVPVDPWGNDYVLDANLGILGTLGSDGALYGEGPDQDILKEYNAFLVPIRATYEGPFGPPRLGNRLLIETSKVFGIVPTQANQVANDIVLIRDFGEVPFVPLGLLGFTLDWGRTRPNEGILALSCTNPSANTYNIPVAADDQVNFSPLVISFTERPDPDGPFIQDPGNWVIGPRPVGGDILGLKIERQVLR